MIIRLVRAGLQLGSLVASKRQILLTVTKLEIQKKYSGTIIGKLWVPLYPLLLLSIYLFVYMVIFRVRFPGYSEFGYTLYVFAGLIPYIGMSDALTSSCLSIKQNMHLIKNVMLPIDLVPIRTVFVSMVGVLVSLSILIMLVAFAGELSLKITLFPIVFILQVMFLIGLALFLSSIALVVPDIANFVNLSMLLFMFISPIGYKPEMVPERFSAIVFLNPVHYLAEAFRMTLLRTHEFNGVNFTIFCLICILCFAFGAAFFRKFKGFLLDHE